MFLNNKNSRVLFGLLFGHAIACVRVYGHVGSDVGLYVVAAGRATLAGCTLTRYPPPPPWSRAKTVLARAMLARVE